VFEDLDIFARVDARNALTATATTSHANSDLAANTVYTYTVIAYDGARQRHDPQPAEHGVRRSRCGQLQRERARQVNLV